MPPRRAPYSRSARLRRGVAGAMTRRVPLGRFLRRRTAYSSSKFGRGVAGATRRVRSSVGREVPLYLPSRRVASEAHVATSAAVTNPFGISGTGRVTLINSIARGTALTERLSSRIAMQMLQIRGRCSVNTAPAVSFASGSFMVVYDRSPTGVTLPTFNEIFDTADIFSFQRLETRDRFQILYRFNVSLEGGGPTAITADSVRNVDLAINMGQRETTFTTASTTGNYADMRTGALYFLDIGSSITATDNLLYQLQFRLVFSA